MAETSCDYVADTQALGKACDEMMILRHKEQERQHRLRELEFALKMRAIYDISAKDAKSLNQDYEIRLRPVPLVKSPPDWFWEVGEVGKKTALQDGQEGFIDQALSKAMDVLQGLAIDES
jgi:hypothetical protein